MRRGRTLVNPLLQLPSQALAQPAVVSRPPGTTTSNFGHSTWTGGCLQTLMFSTHSGLYAITQPETKGCPGHRAPQNAMNTTRIQ
ncbi:hypothetical protein B0H14DRAFT_2676753, partial [Mycena olivaceomarginata]